MDNETMFEFLKQMVDALGKLLGENCEVVLHDLRQPESSIVSIIHGEITGRKIGDPSTNLGLPVFKNPYGNYDKFNYMSKTRSGRTLKCSSVYLKDPTGYIFAAICVNHDISDLLIASSVLKKFTATETQADEHFANDINDVISRILDETLEATNTTLLLADKDERLKLIRTLDDKGVFSVKGTVDRVASLFGVSRVTIYGYLNEVQAMRRENIIQ